MTMKEWFSQLKPVRFYLVLSLAVLFFVVELIVSHVTHSLTLLMDSYHVLCNIMMLSGCIAATKFNKTTSSIQCMKSSSKNITEQENDSKSNTENKPVITLNIRQKETTLNNTFGWARIDVIIMLMSCVFLASLCFSVIVEALQTLVHISHHHKMHHPIPILYLGVVGLILTGFCHLTIGGYTKRDGNFLHITKTGDVVLDRGISSVENGSAFTVSASEKKYLRYTKGVWEISKNVTGCVIVIICAFLCHFTEEAIGKFLDPILSLISATVILFLSYPYLRKNCFILLQTIPDTIDIHVLKNKLLRNFPGIVSIHDLHVWELTTNKIILTAHVIFRNERVYENINYKIAQFFMERGITQVTIQPEFESVLNSTNSLVSTKSGCLVRCQSEDCQTSHCCPFLDENN